MKGKLDPADRSTHGWWPWVGPYFAFLLTIELSGRLPEGWEAFGLVVKPAVPAGLMLWFAARGAYPELRGRRFRPGWVLADIAVGLVLAVAWVLPYIYVPAIRPADLSGFDPAMLGESLVAVTLTVRLIGYGLVTPFLEEIFIRGFVMRYSEVFRTKRDFRDVPLAHWSVTSFCSTIVIFTMGHVPWEWWVAVPWVALSNLWFYYRKDLYAVIVLHGVTNAAILLYVFAVDGVITGPDGQPLSLWFFV